MIDINPNRRSVTGNIKPGPGASLSSPSPSRNNKSKNAPLNLNVVAVAVALLAAVGGYFILNAPYQAMKTTKDTLAVKQTAKDALEEKLINVKKLISRYEQLSKDPAADKIAAGLPQGPDIPGLVSQIESVAVANGMMLRQFELTEEVQTAAAAFDYETESDLTASEGGRQDYQTLSVQVAAEGNYGRLLNFISDLESNQRITDVRAVSFSGDSGSYSLNFDVYYLPQ